MSTEQLEIRQILSAPELRDVWDELAKLMRTYEEEGVDLTTGSVYYIQYLNAIENGGMASYILCDGEIIAARKSIPYAALTGENTPFHLDRFQKNAGKTMILAGVGVREEYQKLGIASMMTREAIDAMLVDNEDVMVITRVHDDNEASLIMHKRMGFETVETINVEDDVWQMQQLNMESYKSWKLSRYS